MFDEKLQTSLDLEYGKRFPLSSIEKITQVSPMAESKTDWSSLPKNTDFSSFGLRHPENNKYFRDTLDYENRLKMIDQEEAELRFLKMKHR